MVGWQWTRYYNYLTCLQGLARLLLPTSWASSHTLRPGLTHCCRACKLPLAETGKKFSLNDAIVKAAAMALRAVPDVNTIVVDGEAISQPTVDISIAVATPGGKWVGQRRKKAASVESVYCRVLSCFVCRCAITVVYFPFPSAFLRALLSKRLFLFRLPHPIVALQA